MNISRTEPALGPSAMTGGPAERGGGLGGHVTIHRLGAKHGHTSCFSHRQNQKVNKTQVSFPVVPPFAHF